MSVYLVKFDGGSRIVEAESFGAAVRLWNGAMLKEFGGEDSGWTEEDQPESVELLDEEPVIR